MHRERIPVYVMTGFLGSGKSTLLARWLKEAPFSGAALIVNEIGEVGIDHATLGFSGDASVLLADACVCCSGLPALNEALEQLFWARLHRSIARFERVVIETTGLADPGPLVASLSLNPLVKERYRIAGTFTALAANNALDTLSLFAEASAQLRGADAVIVTKTDLVGAQELAAVEARLSGARVAHSAHASLALRDALALLAEPAPRAERAVAPRSPPFSRPRSHDAITRFIAIEATSDIDALHARVSELKARYGDSLLRLKGIVRLKDCVAIVQFARGDARAQITAAPADMSDVRSGLTLIVKPGAAR
ncbi:MULTISPECIES: GTP-binding protein [unclassified Caballeronia]|uniref:CobW family GTP-binding protein n=1 Tax=unclassified Caballeronia TaxID=2646786 RepID=UPI001F45ECC9|nr:MULTISPECIES: CobW family GTP-binding protein [unclassified Caballeronia]MCE4546674.1 cobalamin biosynthesis protein CobW [Caballeronia sp. PC1]MCE4572853.1 cobalamin biosynthesis protein CobW [Caballeronia sp. CLC5]